MCVYNFFLPISFPLVYKNGLHFTVYIQSNLSSNIFFYTLTLMTFSGNQL